jgi:hydroxymethylglutaryl-CoA lyase
MESKVISLVDKKKIFEKLLKCHFDRIEITSFVSPKWMPQFSDAEDFCRMLGSNSQNRDLMAFAPNEKGLERLLAFPIKWISLFVATSETFNKKNVNASIDDTCAALKGLIASAHAQSRKARVYISTVFGCPYEGLLDDNQVLSVIRKVCDVGPDEIALSDTIGVATRDQVKNILTKVLAFFPADKIALHLHNTYGLALSAAETGYELGIHRFDGSTGGIGGCPYAKGATGNVPLELLLYAFYRRGLVKTFPKDEIFEVLQFLDGDLKLEVRSPLFDIAKRGGTIFGAMSAPGGGNPK